MCVETIRVWSVFLVKSMYGLSEEFMIEDDN